MKFIPQKLEGWGYRTVKTAYNPTFNCFRLIHPCYRRTGGRTSDSV